MVRTLFTLAADTIREALANRIFWGLFALSTAMILFFLLLLRIDVVEGALATVSLFGQSLIRGRDVNSFVIQVHAAVATFLYSWGMALAVFASSGLIPGVLEAGRISLLLSKPVRRWEILAGRYLGNLLVVSANTCYLVLGVWLVFGWKTGVWRPQFLWTMATTVFIFAILLTAVIWIGVVFESSALATMATLALMVMSPILAQNRIAERLLSSEWSRVVWRWLYYALPKVYDLARMTLHIVRDRPVDGVMPVWSSAVFAAVMFGSAVYIFSRRDF